MEFLTTTFKIRLQSYGALRPDAWEHICSLVNLVELKAEQHFVRHEGDIAYLASGLLKEHDASERIAPAIINFVLSEQFLFTRRANQNHYLKACSPCLLYSWKAAHLQALHREFGELKIIYDGICADYDTQLLLRMRLLEMPVQDRIALFRLRFKAALPYLKKIDIANYLHVSYTNLLAKF